MLTSCTQLEQRERLTLSSYAQMSGDSLGREYPEPPHPFRTGYQRDRARIIHAKSFRRLEQKTQVFLSGSGDHLRTRLTHTIEVANVGRTVARSLSLNEDLTEAIALAHDLGHSPFGHSGEEMLNTLMREHGGFEHNMQSLKIVQSLEKKYPRFDGLNLTYEVTEGLRKHDKFYQSSATESSYQCPSLEAQIANLSDEITYYSHDLDDGLNFELLSLEQLNELTIWSETQALVQQHFPDLSNKQLATYVIRCLIDREVDDLIATSSQRIIKAGVETVEDVRNLDAPLIRYSDKMLADNRQMRAFLYKNLYYHPRVHDHNQHACRLLEELFNHYLKHPEILPDSITGRIAKDGLHRSVCDHIACMTDPFLIQDYRRVVGETKLVSNFADY